MGGYPQGKRTQVQLTGGEVLTCDSALEARLVSHLDQKVVDFEHHPERFSFEIRRTYTTDLKIFPLHGGSEFYVEVKGYWPTDERQAWWHMYQQNKGKDLRLAFQQPGKYISKNSKTTYAEWATKKGIAWCDVSGSNVLPASWTGVV